MINHRFTNPPFWWPQHLIVPRATDARPHLICCPTFQHSWGFDYKFTNYMFRKNIDLVWTRNICVYIYIYTYNIYVCMYVYIYIYIYNARGVRFKCFFFEIQCLFGNRSWWSCCQIPVCSTTPLWNLGVPWDALACEFREVSLRLRACVVRS